MNVLCLLLCLPPKQAETREVAGFEVSLQHSTRHSTQCTTVVLALYARLCFDVSTFIIRYGDDVRPLTPVFVVSDILFHGDSNAAAPDQPCGGGGRGDCGGSAADARGVRAQALAVPPRRQVAGRPRAQRQAVRALSRAGH